MSHMRDSYLGVMSHLFLFYGFLYYIVKLSWLFTVARSKSVRLADTFGLNFHKKGEKSRFSLF